MKTPIRWARALALVAFGVIAAGLLIELGVRIATGALFVWGGPDAERYGMADPLLGRIPRPGVSMRHPTKGFTISTVEDSIRSNGATPPRAGRPLTVAVGDSFAFGDEVDDAESWPAILERLTGRRVINAAIPGFGLDQAVLRAEQMANRHAPETIVVSFIPHDVLRCQMSYWQGHPKPYFSLDGDGLRLYPVPPSPPIAHARLKRWLSFSVTLDLLFPHLLHGRGPAMRDAHQQGREVACRLMARLAALGRARGARVVVLAQPQAPDATAEHLELKDGVLACAARNDLPSLDLFPVLERLPAAEREQLFDGHMTAAGNQLVATELERFLAGPNP